MTWTGTRVAAAVALLLLAASLSAEAQPAGKVHRIGFLSSNAAPSPVHEGFRQGLRERGWIERQNVVIDYRFADGHERLPARAADLVRLKVDIIVVLATPATSAAKNATGTIPIVMIAAADPVKSGFIASLGRPGGNVTGLTYTGAGHGGTRETAGVARGGRSQGQPRGGPFEPTLARETASAVGRPDDAAAGGA